jgi:hypothetical protein
MKKSLHNRPVRPCTFEKGHHYLWRQGGIVVEVEFVAYDNQAAFVIVRDAAGYRWRCAREELYRTG